MDRLELRVWLALPLLLAALSVGPLATGPLAAAEPELVGVLAIAVEDDAASRLDLSEEQREQLLDLIDEREGEGVNLALSVNDLPFAERRERLAPFRAESEKAGLALLDATQRQALEQLRIERAGLAALAEPALAEQIGLTEEQQQKLAELVAQRDEQLAEGRNPTTVRAYYERALAKVLEPDQRDAFAALTSGEPPAARTAASRDDADDSAADDESQAEDGPQAEVETEADVAMDDTVEEDGSGEDVEDDAAEEEAQSPAAAGRRADDKPSPPADGLLRFGFKYAPWADVLDWFAEQAELELYIPEAPPQGTFNYTDDSRGYTPAQAIDVINRALSVKGFVLVRNDKMLMLVNLEDGVPENFIPWVELDDLDSRGEYELIRVLFKVDRLTPEEAAAEIRTLTREPGKVEILAKSKQLLVTETAARLRMIRSVLSEIEAADTPAAGDLKVIELVSAMPDEVMPLARQLLDIPADAFATTDGSLKIAVDVLGGKLFVNGKPEMISKLEDIIAELDKPVGGEGSEPASQESLQLEVYFVTAADATLALQVLQTLLVGKPGVKLSVDAKTGTLVALARPSDHATIKATLDQMQHGAGQVDVIQLRRLDPQLAVLAINKLFGGADGTAAGSMKVDADTTNRQLLLRGSASQIAQVRQLLEKMGESGESTRIASADGGNIRTLPLTGRSARAALEQVQQAWEGTRRNKIRIVNPSATAPSLRESDETLPGVDSGFDQRIPGIRSITPRRAAEAPARGTVPELPDYLDDDDRIEFGPGSEEAPPAAEEQESDEAATSGPDASTDGRRRTRAQFAVDAIEAPAPVDALADADEPLPSIDGSEIIVSFGPGGIMIASRDLEALDEFERMLNDAATLNYSGTADYTIFYLIHANAEVVSETLAGIFGGGTSSSSSGGGSVLGDLAGAAFGNAGGIVGNLLGGSSGESDSAATTVTATGKVMIVPDMRLNALIVQANAADLDTLDQLIEVLDQPDGPETAVATRPGLIPVFNTSATEIATIVKEVYAEKMAGARNNRQPTPEEFMQQMLRGGRNRRGGGGGGNGGGEAEEETEKMTVGVDARSNSLIVNAPKPLFAEVESLVRELDQATTDTSQAMRVLTLRRSNPETIQRALSALVGTQVQTQNAPDSSGQAASGNQPQQRQERGQQGGDAQAEAVRRQQQMDFWRNLQRGGGGQGDGGRRRGGGEGGRGR